MYYYLNSLYLYSLIGFIIESTVYKITKSKRHSGIFYGPFTYVYGFGILSLLLLKKHLLDNLKVSKLSKLIITFILSTIILTLIELIGGHILNLVFNIDMWNYTKKTYNLGKYICLDLAITWGFLGTLYIYYIKPGLDKILNLIPQKLTIALFIINTIDLILTLINKKWKFILKIINFIIKSLFN